MAPDTETRTRLIREIRQITREPDDPATTAKLVAEALVAAAPGVTLLTGDQRAGSPDGYVRHTLHTGAAFSIAAVVWRPGQLTEIHDHLVWCSWMVLQGAETETLYDIDGGRLIEVGTCERGTGSVSGVAPPDDIHKVTNNGDTVAITLHVYGADLSRHPSVRRVYRLPG